MAEKKKTTGPIINQLIIKAPQRKTSDVGTWRNALRSADSGRVKTLFDLYEDLLIDGVLADAVSKRIEAVTNSELTFQDASGKEVDDITTLIDTPAMEELITQIISTKFWGRAGIEFDFTDGFSVYEIPKKHINLDDQVILRQETDVDGISYEGDDNLLILGKKRDFGLFLKTAPLIIWKRGGFGDWAQWLEIFGMPQRVGKYSSYDIESRQLLTEALEKAGSAPYIVIPKESDVETTNNTGSGSSGTSYNDFRKACQEETLITILGQTLTTIQGDKGARSLGEVHQEVAESKYKSDIRFVHGVLNHFVLPILERRGYPVKGGTFVFPESPESLSVNEIVQLSKIIKIPALFLHDKYGIPVPAKGEDIAGSAVETNQDLSPDDPPKKKRLTDFFANAPTQERGNFATRLIDNITGRVRLSDKYSININKLLQEALTELYENEKQGVKQPVVSVPLFNISNNALQKGVDSVFSDPDFGKKNEEFVNEFQYNTAVFSAFKNHKQTKDILELLHDENGTLRSFRNFKKLALKISKDYNENWLRTEYNTAIRSARNAVNYRKWLKTEHLYPNLEYMETTAAHARASHLDYVGTILPIRHEWWDTHMPPSDWNCACSVRPTDKEITAVPDGEFVPPVFQNNPGKTAEFVKIKETA